jgi:ATPase subunit of ABC transporter with duplicated ATPase domains
LRAPALPETLRGGMATTVPLLSARGLVKSFGGRRVLDGLDLELAAGSRIGVVESIEVLEDALEHYDGTVVAVSHDRYFLDRIADRIVHVAEGAVRAYEGGWSANGALVGA